MEQGPEAVLACHSAGFRSVLIVVILLRGIWMFNKFDVIWLLTKGGPLNETETLPTLAYRKAFLEFDSEGGPLSPPSRFDVGDHYLDLSAGFFRSTRQSRDDDDVTQNQPALLPLLSLVHGRCGCCIALAAQEEKSQTRTPSVSHGKTTRYYGKSLKQIAGRVGLYAAVR